MVLLVAPRTIDSMNSLTHSTTFLETQGGGGVWPDLQNVLEFILNCFGIELLRFNLYLTRFEIGLTKSFQFDDLFFDDFYKLHCCNH